MVWWIWVLFGFLLLALEMTSFGLHLVFFGIGAIAVGFLVAIGIGGPLWVQFLLFTGISILSLVLFRGPLLKRIRKDVIGEVRNPDRDDVVGGVAIATEDIPVDSVGQAELRGSSWQARNVGGAPVAKGQRCTVDRVDGLMLLIRAQ